MPRPNPTTDVPRVMAGDANNTTARWLPFHRSLAWLRQRCPGATDKWAYGKLQQALLEEICRLSEGVPIDKFRYPYGSGTADLVVLIRNNHLTFEDIRWQNVECNLEWLERDFEWFERDWPPPALEVEAASVPAEDAALKPIEPAAPEPAPPSKFAVSKPAQSSLEVPAPVSPSPQEPTPIALLVKAALVALATELEPEEPKPEEPEPEEPEPEEPEPEEPEPEEPEPKEPVVQSSGNKKTEKTAKDFVYAKDFVPWAVTHYPRDTVGVPDYPRYLRNLAGNRWSKKTIQNELSKLK